LLRKNPDSQVRQPGCRAVGFARTVLSVRESLDLTLRDGSPVTVRPIEPEDKPLLARAFDRLSPASRYRRFLAPTAALTARALRYLTEVDHHDHEALIALDPTGDLVGVARYVRAGAADRAEAAVTVVDDWQGRGLGTALLELLAERGHEERISKFTALLLAQNTEMLDLLRHLGSVEVADPDAGTIAVEADIHDVAERQEGRELLRRAAAGHLDYSCSKCWTYASEPG
jgi:RimJ/RimL family protein N-acetyltransferase